MQFKSLHKYKPKWCPGTIQEVTGPVSYTVMLQDNKVVHRHVHQIRARHCDDSSGRNASQSPSNLNDASTGVPNIPAIVLEAGNTNDPSVTQPSCSAEPAEPETETETPLISETPSAPPTNVPSTRVTANPSASAATVVDSRPTREHRAPVWMNDYVKQ